MLRTIRQNWRRIVLVLLGLVGVLGLWLWAHRPQETLLLSRAIRLTDPINSERYCWLSDRQLLLLHEGRNNHYRAVRLDIPTKTLTKLPALEATISKIYLDAHVFASPDGKWLLCPPFDGEPDATAITLDGTQVRHWPVDEDVLLAWIPGSSRWMDMHLVEPHNSDDTTIAQILVYDVNNPQSKQTLRGDSTIHIQYSDLQAVPVVTPDHRLVVPYVTYLIAEHIPAIQTTSCRLETDHLIPTHTYTCHLPVPLPTNEELALSPRADRLAWRSVSVHVPPWQQWLHRLFSHYKVKSQYVTTLYTARLDGSGLKEVGHIHRAVYLEGLQWSPDGKQLSFYYGNALYTVPAD
jgi:hypothetical protein